MMRETHDAGKDSLSVGWRTSGGGVRALRRTPRLRYAISVDGRPRVRITALAVVIGKRGRVCRAAWMCSLAPTHEMGRLDVVVLAPRTWRDILGLVARVASRDGLRADSRTAIFHGPARPR